ncbi:MAG: hypothetical protein Q8L48_09760 [Archangium sp.]|nr:hypothetical protein [Archangium sp.]
MVFVLASACSSPAGEPDAAARADQDSGLPDAGSSDAGPSDAGPSDAGSSDAGPPEPIYLAGVHTLLWQDRFDGLASDAELLANYTTLNPGSIHLDPSGGLGGSGAARLDWTGSTSCADDSVLLERSFPATPELYVQFSVRYDPGFVFDWTQTSGPCSGNAKKLFFLWAVSGSRFDFISENHVLGMGSDYDHPLFAQNTGAGLSPEQLGDGSWHRVTIHTRQSSTPTATDGFIEAWVDGRLRWSHAAIATHNSGGYDLFKMPTTFNQGSPVTQTEWLDGLSLWRP